jgi:hypothetical protein
MLLVKDSAIASAPEGALRFNSSKVQVGLSGTWTDVGGTSGSSAVVSRKTSAYPVDPADVNGTVFIGDSTSDFAFTLEATPAANRYLTFKNVNTGVITVAGNGLLIDREAAYTLGQDDAITIIYEISNTRWLII